MPTADFWVDWSVAATVDELRRILPPLVAEAGCELDEAESIATSPDWARFVLSSGGAVGEIRAQTAEAGRSQVVVAPTGQPDRTALQTLNRTTVYIYCCLVMRSLLAPPAPMEVPPEPLVQG